MSNIKLHEATKQFKISNKLAMFFLEQIQMPVKSHSSVISFDQLELLREFSQNTEKHKEILKSFNELKDKKIKSQEPVPEPEVMEEPETPAPEPVPEKKPEPVPPKSIPTTKIPKKTIPMKPEPVHEKKPAPPPATPPSGSPAKEKAREMKPAQKEATPSERKPVEGGKTAPVKPHPGGGRATPAQPPVKEKKKPAWEERPSPSYHIYQRHDRGRHQRVQHKHSAPKETRPRPEKVEPDIKYPESLTIPDLCTLRELSEMMDVKLKYLEDKTFQLQLEQQSNQFMDVSVIQTLCDALNIKLEVLLYEDFIHKNNIKHLNAELKPRAPVVTVMGHVDHGKTTLLDTLRKTRVAEREAGGITQKIGAYQLNTREGTFVFIDTPGHEAFTNLRARGAQVTDIVILVVAANDGIQPQTIEAIQHARAAEVPMIVAINKIDLQGASPDKIKQDLTKHNILVEDWGGDVVSVEISAKMNQNLDQLLEMIHLVTQMEELKAYTDIPARGTVIESRLDPQLGPIGTVLIQHGKLKKGDHFICGKDIGKIKSIFDDTGRIQGEAGVPSPVEIMGFASLPNAGDVFQIVDDLDKAQKVVDSRRVNAKDAKSRNLQAEKKLNFQNLFQLLEQNKIQVFPIIIKADNYGSSEVLEQLLLKQSQEKLKIEIIANGIGNITERDILLASTANAVILGFNVKAPQKILPLAKQENVEIKLYSVIYHLIEEITKAIQGKIEPEYEDVQIGRVKILQKFKISKIGFIAGCVVLEGKVTRKSKLKVFRNDDLIFEGQIESLKRIKDEVSEVKAGIECGIRIKNFNNFEPEDIMETFETVIAK